ncbi:MAG: tetratricopeptide repeat protein [Burkholderiaceae bacterium]
MISIKMGGGLLAAALQLAGAGLLTAAAQPAAVQPAPAPAAPDPAASTAPAPAAPTASPAAPETRTPSGSGSGTLGDAERMSRPPAADRDSVPGALAEARRLAAQGRRNDALAALDAGLRRTPGDAQLRFQKGVVLAEMGNSEQALELFKALTEEFPELPEPHNNLATLYAAAGQLDQARDALETALRALPSYGLASENLGDIYLRLAERAWRRAADAAPRNEALKDKLSLARELIARVSPSGSRPAAAETPVPAGTRSPAGAQPAPSR